MKRTAFLQALALFLLLTGSWMLLVLRFQGTSPDPIQTTASSPIASSDSSDLSDPSDLSDSSDSSDPPPEWQTWWDYLGATASPMEMRTALEALWTGLSSLQQEEAIERILAFMESGADMQTGLAMQPGPGPRLRGAFTLRAVLADWLGAIDPEIAARTGRRILASKGTDLSPDEYVVHLRNVARTGKSQSDRADVMQWFESLLDHEPWMESPNAAIAEAMDFAVHLEDAELSRRVGRLLPVGQPLLLRRAASLAMERLVDARPLETLPTLLEEPSIAGRAGKMRAGYFARLDPATPQARALLDRYFLDAPVSRDERSFFLESFPNLNESRSHNLISHQNSTTQPGAYIGRLERALASVERWLDEVPEGSLQEQLEAARSRLQRQLSP